MAKIEDTDYTLGEKFVYKDFEFEPAETLEQRVKRKLKEKHDAEGSIEEPPKKWNVTGNRFTGSIEAHEDYAMDCRRYVVSFNLNDEVHTVATTITHAFIAQLTQNSPGKHGLVVALAQAISSVMAEGLARGWLQVPPQAKEYPPHDSRSVTTKHRAIDAKLSVYGNEIRGMSSGKKKKG